MPWPEIFKVLTIDAELTPRDRKLIYTSVSNSLRRRAKGLRRKIECKSQKPTWYGSGGCKAGLRNARAKGKRLGRPRVIVDAGRIAALRTSSSSWSEIAHQTGWTKGTIQRAFESQNARPGLPKNV